MGEPVLGTKPRAYGPSLSFAYFVGRGVTHVHLSSVRATVAGKRVAVRVAYAGSASGPSQAGDQTRGSAEESLGGLLLARAGGHLSAALPVVAIRLSAQGGAGHIRAGDHERRDAPARALIRLHHCSDNPAARHSEAIFRSADLKTSPGHSANATISTGPPPRGIPSSDARDVAAQLIAAGSALAAARKRESCSRRASGLGPIGLATSTRSG